MRALATLYRRFETAWCAGDRPSMRHFCEFVFEFVNALAFIAMLVLLPALLGEG